MAFSPVLPELPNNNIGFTMKFKNFTSSRVNVWSSAGHCFTIDADEIKNAPDHMSEDCLKQGLVPEGSFDDTSDLSDEELQAQAIGKTELSVQEQEAIKRSEAAKKAAATRAANASKKAKAE